MVKQQARATIGLPGVVEDGAHGKNDQEPGRPGKMRKRQHATGNHNRKRGLCRESDKPIVVMKRSNVRGAKGLYCKRATVKRGGEPLA